MKEDKKAGFIKGTTRHKVVFYVQFRGNKIVKLQAADPDPEWVKVGTVSEMTGWNYLRLRKARNEGHIKYQKREDGFWYDLNSLNEKFLK